MVKSKLIKRMVENSDSKNYELWTRVIHECETAIATAETEVKVNTIFLEAACEEREKYPKPEPKNTTNTLTG